MACGASSRSTCPGALRFWIVVPLVRRWAVSASICVPASLLAFVAGMLSVLLILSSFVVLSPRGWLRLPLHDAGVRRRSWCRAAATRPFACGASPRDPASACSKVLVCEQPCAWLSHPVSCLSWQLSELAGCCQNCPFLNACRLLAALQCTLLLLKRFRCLLLCRSHGRCVRCRRGGCDHARAT